MTTESGIDAANKQMATIADEKSDGDKRARLRAIWQPIAFDLIDKSTIGLDDCDLLRLAADPTFVGVTCDTQRPVFLAKQTSTNGFVYRKFRVGERPSAH